MEQSVVPSCVLHVQFSSVIGHPEISLVLWTNKPYLVHALATLLLYYTVDSSISTSIQAQTSVLQ